MDRVFQSTAQHEAGRNAYDLARTLLSRFNPPPSTKPGGTLLPALLSATAGQFQSTAQHEAGRNQGILFEYVRQFAVFQSTAQHEAGRNALCLFANSEMTVFQSTAQHEAGRNFGGRR